MRNQRCVKHVDLVLRRYSNLLCKGLKEWCGIQRFPLKTKQVLFYNIQTAVTGSDRRLIPHYFIKLELMDCNAWQEAQLYFEIKMWQKSFGYVKWLIYSIYLYNHLYRTFWKKEDIQDLNGNTTPMSLSMRDRFHHAIISIPCALILIQPLVPLCRSCNLNHA